MLRTVLLLSLLLGSVAFSPAVGSPAPRTVLRASGGNTRVKKTMKPAKSFVGGMGGGMGGAVVAAAGKPTSKWAAALDAAAAAAVTEGGSAVAEVAGLPDALVVVRTGPATWHGLQAACGRCQFPLVGGALLGGEGKAKFPLVPLDADLSSGALAIACGACGAAFDLRSGEARGAVEVSGMLQSFTKTMMSSRPTKPIAAYATRAAKDGGVFVDALSATRKTAK
jgi:nitrite reductase/ring-hydroxylating ferredoxin subunit